MSTVGDNIKRKRIELKLTQEELANKLGYKSRTAIAKIEAGVNDLTPTKIKAFADALDTVPSFIMGWEDEEKAGVVKESISYYHAQITTNKENDLESLLEHSDDMVMCASIIVKNTRITNDLTEKSVAEKAEIELSEYLDFEVEQKNIGASKILRIVSAVNMQHYYFIGLLSGFRLTLKTINSLSIDEEIKKHLKESIMKKSYVN